MLYDALTTCRDRLTGRPLSIDTPMESVLDETIQYYASQLDERMARRLFERPTVNWGELAGGEAVNSVPPTASTRLDVRLTVGVHPAEVLSEIRECIRSHDHVRITDTSWTAGTYTDPDAPFVNAVADVAEDVLAEPIYRRSATGSGDAQQFRSAGIPTVEFAPGTETAHAEDEYTTTAALSQIAQIYMRLPYALETDAQTPTEEQ